MPNEFFSWEFLGSFAGAVLAVTVITSAVGYLAPAAKPYLKWVAVALSVALMVFMAWNGGARDAASYVMAVLNGFVVFLASVGANTVTTQPAESALEVAGLEDKRFWARW